MSKARENPFKQIAIELAASSILLLVGIGLLVGGVFQAVSTTRFLARAHEVQGVVVDRSVSRPRIGERGLALYAPIVEYRDSNGRVRLYEPDTRDSSSNYAIGQTILLYVQDADDGSPQRVRLANAADPWFGSAIALFMGAGFTIWGCIAVFIVWSAKPNPQTAKRRKISPSRKTTKPTSPSSNA
ncbi:DUF3592 domain-containing protein [Uliginosibacterium sediminicola]|uniref:DUF3592 domain-containing protein n=1 Tax=Uliginosibacterium sediminicola TaxID=2024550 RepID=A0ABU9Z0U8_9RHOO